MIGIIVVMIVSVIVMYNQHKNYMMDKKRIKELEERLEEYYNKRENRLIKKFKDIEQQ
jgi:uncharacterized membrane protein (DUF106 family)